MKILVTGGAGFIGSNVVDGYIKAGHECIAVDNLYSGKWENLNKDAKFYLMDIRSEEFGKLVERERPDIINHHAAQISVPLSVKEPKFDASVNVMGFINVLEAARKNGTKKVIFISSGGAIYGEAEEYPTSEEYPPAPVSPYAITKSVSEDYLRFYREEYGLNYTILRYANIYGPRQIPHGEAGVVAIFMDRLLSSKRCIIYHYEDDLDGMIRDYCYVGDVVDANISAVSAGDCEAFNIGTGVETKTLWLFEEVARAIDKQVGLSPELMTPGTAGARPGDIKRSCLNIKKAQKLLDWSPKVSLREGIKKTLSWRLSINS